jgi:hypothetical protein
MNSEKELLISLFSQSLNQIDALLPEANIRDLLAIAKESISLMIKLDEIESNTPDVKPVFNSGFLNDFKKKLNETVGVDNANNYKN